MAQEPPRVVSTVSTFRGKLVNPTQLLANQSAEMAITLLDKEAALPQNSKVLAVVKPTVQNELTIVHCRIVETDIRITFSNPGSKTITPIADEEYEIFVY